VCVCVTPDVTQSDSEMANQTKFEELLHTVAQPFRGGVRVC
jgi:hypothetical protein